MTAPTKPCEPWCGTPNQHHKEGWVNRRDDGRTEWCSYGCADAGRSLAPAAPAPEAKPTRVELHQRWRTIFGHQVEYYVAAKDGDRWLIAGPGVDDGCIGAGPHRPEYILCDTFLGYAKPAAPAEHVCGCKPGNWCTHYPVDGKAVWVGIDPGYAAAEPVVVPVPAPPRPIRREVSCDGRNWCDYARLVDADPFEAYPWRGANCASAVTRGPCEKAVHETRANGGFGETWTTVYPAPKTDPGRALTASDEAGAAASALVSR